MQKNPAEINEELFLQFDLARIFIAEEEEEEEEEPSVVVSLKDITERKQMVEELKSAHEYARNLIDSSLDMIIAVDKERRIVEFNKAAQVTFGYAKEEVLGKHIDILYADPAEGLKTRTITRRTGRFSAEVMNKRKNGELFPSFLSASILRGKKGEFLGIMGVSRDITERKRQELIQQVLYQISSAVHTTKSISKLSGVIQQELGTIIDTKNFFIALYNKKDDTLSLPYYKDEMDHFETFPAGKTCTAYVIRNDRPLLANREKIDELVKAGEVEIIGTLSKVWLGVPLKLGKEITGAVVIQSYTNENAYGEKDLEILKYIAEQLGLFTECKRAEEKLQERLQELEIYYKATIGREGRIIELKQQVNELLVQLGKEKKYDV